MLNSKKILLAGVASMALGILPAQAQMGGTVEGATGVNAEMKSDGSTSTSTGAEGKDARGGVMVEADTDTKAKLPAEVSSDAAENVDAGSKGTADAGVAAAADAETGMKVDPADVDPSDAAANVDAGSKGTADIEAKTPETVEETSGSADMNADAETGAEMKGEMPVDTPSDAAANIDAGSKGSADAGVAADTDMSGSASMDGDTGMPTDAAANVDAGSKGKADAGVAAAADADMTATMSADELSSRLEGMGYTNVTGGASSEGKVSFTGQNADGEKTDIIVDGSSGAIVSTTPH